MRRVSIPLVEIELIAVTRVALGAGIGLLLAGRLTNSKRRSIGWLLVALGGLTTIPLRSDVMGRQPASGAPSDRQLPASLTKENCDE
jgi:hypothetical protein